MYSSKNLRVFCLLKSIGMLYRESISEFQLLSRNTDFYLEISEFIPISVWEILFLSWKFDYYAEFKLLSRISDLYLTIPIFALEC